MHVKYQYTNIKIYIYAITNNNNEHQKKAEGENSYNCKQNLRFSIQIKKSLNYP